jgi:predicted AAA+ superfamily ATPase
MLENFEHHNLFSKDFQLFMDNDPHLYSLKTMKFVHPLDWWSRIDWKNPGIYILTGGRQIGKSTSTKLLIKHALETGLFKPKDAFYIPCDQIDDYHHLLKIIYLFLEEAKPEGGFLLIIDEVTFVKGWDRAIKAAADDGLFRKGFCILTGSDSIILKEAANRFPGRRGNADLADFHIHPLNFAEYFKLTGGDESKVFSSFEAFLKCGGYLRAINELHMFGEIRKATYLTFEQWIKGDFEKRGKNLSTLTYILKTLYETVATQVTYSSLAHKMGQVVKETFIDYIGFLQRMDVIFELQAFDQNTLHGFPKKARKIHFADPFIMDTIKRWLVEERFLKDAENEAVKVESIAAAHCLRKFPCYYIKTEGEIDIVAVVGKTFVPIEVKWTNQLRPQDMKQLMKYKNSVILTKRLNDGDINGIRSLSLPEFLLREKAL